MTKVIQNWKIVPVVGSEVCLVGEVDGKEIQTTCIKLARPGEIKTENNHYILGDKNPGMWEIQLQIKRPEKFANLQKQGVL